MHLTTPDAPCQDKSEHQELAAHHEPAVACPGMTAPTPLVDLLTRLVAEFGSQTALALAIGVSPSRMSRLLGGTYSLEVLNCLRLADVSGESPSVVLRAAGKGDIADLLERLYGKDSRGISLKHHRVIELWDRLASGDHAIALTMLDRLACPLERRRRTAT